MTRKGVVPGAPGIVLADLEATERPFHFLSGRVSLALVTTVGERWRRNFERLVSPADLQRWLEQAGLVDPAGSRVTARHLDAARDLRDALHVLSCNAEDGETYDALAVKVVEEYAAPPSLVPTFDGPRVASNGSAVSGALSTVARDGIDLFTSSDGARVRHCAADDCSLVFLDVSRTGSRRWCTMRGCGNRAKIRAHRSRAV